MRKQIVVLVGLGMLAIGIAWVSLHRINGESLDEIFSLEPKYEGHTFTYWMHHWYLNPWGSPVNAEAVAALQAMGPNATPYLVKWIGKPPTYGLNFNYPEHALEGFKVLGPAAKPAIPALVKLIGQNQGYPERALQAIGRGAVPPLADKLLETLADRHEAVMNWRDPRYKSNFFHIQESIIHCLSEMGTNAEPAIPALLKAFNAKHGWMWEATPYTALVNVGKNHPEIVIPVLIDALTNSASPASNRGAVADAMALFGTNEADAFLPVLTKTLSNKNTDDFNRRRMAEALATVGHNRADTVVPVLITAFTNTAADCQDGIAVALATFGNEARPALPVLLPAAKSPKQWLRMNVIVAIKQIAPELPGTLTPLIRDLGCTETFVRQETIYALGRLGTNSLDAAPALLKCLSHPDTQTRIDATRSLNQMGVTSDEFIADLGENLSCTNEFMVQEAEETLSALAGHSESAFVTLVKKGICGQIRKSYQDQAKFLLGIATRTNSQVLLEGLDNPDAQVRYGTLEVFNEFRFPALRPYFVPEAIPKLTQLSTNDPDPRVRSRAADALRWQSQDP